MPTPATILVFGGAGFLGSSIVRSALAKGWSVISVSRSGRPQNTQPWHDRVEWVEGDALNPSSFSDALSRADHVAHTIGVLDYRGFMNGGRPSRVLDKIGLTLYDAIREVLPSGSSASSRELEKYDTLNREAAVSVSTEAARHGNLKSFVYVSAAGGFPGIPQRYISTKREAENFIGSLPGRTFRSIFFRPGFMFSDDRGFTKPVARLLGLSYALNSSLDSRLSPVIGAAGVKPLDVDRVGSAIVEACTDERIEGVVEVHQIEALADIRWRAEMIV